MTYKQKRWYAVILAVCMALILVFPITVSAAESDDTDGTEIHVMQAEQLEIQLGTDWAGVEFQLKTDTGLYPGSIPVGEDGVLRLEIGGSTTYILSCMNSATAAPDPTQAPATEGDQLTDTENSEVDGAVDADVNVPAEPDSNEQPTEEQPVEENTIAGIPILHLALFGGGLLIAVGALITMHFVSRRRAVDAEYEDDDDEE